MIEFHGVRKIYEGEEVVALDGLNLKVARGEFVFLTGPSGAGKSTVLELLTREVVASEGRVILDGHDLALLPQGKVPWLRRRLGVIFQDFRLLYDRDAFENVAFALRVLGLPESEVRRDTQAALEKVGLVDKAKLRPHKLSGGQQQRLAVARALARDPDLILADEPTGNLDAETSWEIFRLLIKLNERGATLLVATHNQAVIQSLGKRVVRLRAGRVEFDGNPSGSGVGDMMPPVGGGPS